MGTRSRRRRPYQTFVEPTPTCEQASGRSDGDSDTGIVGSSPDMARTERRADKVIRRWCALSAAYGVIPVPGVELAAVSASQLLMLREIAGAHGVEFSWKKGNLLITSLLGGTASGASMMLLSKFVAPMTSVLSLAGLNSTMTYVLGKRFSAHLEKGGTLDDFDIASVARECTVDPFGKRAAPKPAS